LELSAEALGPEAETVAETIFKVFDASGNGQMSFCDYMIAVQSTKLETPEDKLTWIFRMYDKVRLMGIFNLYRT
jgi:Ca2+-binding EF-hand superfamily protein